MTTLSANSPRVFEGEGFNHLPVIAADVIYEGAAVGENGSGYMRPLVAADPFMGFAEEKADNSDGSAGDKKVKLRTKGIVQLAVSGAAIGNIGDNVYASDDNTFTLTSTGNTLIGTIYRYVSSGVVMVKYEV